MNTLSEFLRSIFLSQEFMPHGHCYLWKPGLVWLHVISDTLIGLAYLGISATLYAMVRRIRLPFSVLILSFGLFIAACGCTHFMEVWTLWTPNYWLSGGVKALTAVASVATAAFLFPLQPKVYQTATAAALSEARRVELEAKTVELVQLNDQLRRMAQEEVRQSEERFRSLVLASAQVVWTRNAAGDAVDDSPSWRAFTGQSYQEMAGTGWTDAIHPDDRQAVLTAWREVLASKQVLRMEYRLRRPDGRYTYTLARAVPLLDSMGEVREWVGTNSDISERKQAESELKKSTREALEAVRIRDEFLSIASHELKTPLTSLQLQLELLDRATGPEPHGLAPKLASAKKQVRRLAALNESLLDVSRITSGRLDIVTQPVDLSALLRENVERMKSQLHDAGCELHLDIAEGVTGYWDPLRLDQVVVNLLNNASKYAAGAPVHLALASEGGNAVLSVSDQGPGLDPSSLERVFNKFERAVPAHHFGGLGLGLYISRQVVEAMGGTIQLQSRPGEGATFTVRLPLAAAPPRQVEPRRLNQSG